MGGGFAASDMLFWKDSSMPTLEKLLQHPELYQSQEVGSRQDYKVGCLSLGFDLWKVKGPPESNTSPKFFPLFRQNSEQPHGEHHSQDHYQHHGQHHRRHYSRLSWLKALGPVHGPG